MEDIKREELISAYLDGELDATEAARAEQWIAEDPQAKKLFEDLKMREEELSNHIKIKFGDVYFH